MSSFSKEAKCDLCPDAPRRPPGLLRGRSALPPAPHLDGQSDRGLRQFHVPVGETETAMPKCTPEWNLLHRGKSLNLCISLALPHPSDPLLHYCSSTEETPEPKPWTALSSLPSPLTLLNSPDPHVSMTSPQFSFVITITLLYNMWRNKNNWLPLCSFSISRNFEITVGRLYFPTCTTTWILGLWWRWPNMITDEAKLVLTGKWEHHFRIVSWIKRAHKKPNYCAAVGACLRHL